MFEHTSEHKHEQYPTPVPAIGLWVPHSHGQVTDELRQFKGGLKSHKGQECSERIRAQCGCSRLKEGDAINRTDDGIPEVGG
jgi:hypothetical protein